MKRRYRYLLNFCSFGLLGVALYLNFAKNETSALVMAIAQEADAPADKAISKKKPQVETEKEKVNASFK